MMKRLARPFPLVANMSILLLLLASCVALCCAQCDLASLSVGTNHGLLTINGKLMGWGDREHEKLLDRPSVNEHEVLPLSDGGSSSQLDGTFSHTCAAERSSCAVQLGKLYCFGLVEKDSSLGNKYSEDTQSIKNLHDGEVANLSDVTAVACRYKHTCVIAGGLVLCFGNNDVAQLGVGNSAKPSGEPVEPLGLPNNGAVAVSVSRVSSCAVYDVLYCWGRNHYRVLVHESTSDRVVQPIQMSAPTAALSVALGSQGGCALEKPSRRLWCFGNNRIGLPAAGNLDRGVLPPAQVVELEEVDAVSVTDANTGCAIRSDTKQVACWGQAVSGSLGRAPSSNSGKPTVFGVFAREIAAGEEGTCVITAGGLAVKCWGDLEYTRDNGPELVYQCPTPMPTPPTPQPTPVPTAPPVPTTSAPPTTVTASAVTTSIVSQTTATTAAVIDEPDTYTALYAVVGVSACVALLGCVALLVCLVALHRRRQHDSSRRRRAVAGGSSGRPHRSSGRSAESGRRSMTRFSTYSPAARRSAATRISTRHSQHSRAPPVSNFGPVQYGALPRRSSQVAQNAEPLPSDVALRELVEHADQIVRPTERRAPVDVTSQYQSLPPAAAAASTIRVLPEPIYAHGDLGP